MTPPTASPRALVRASAAGLICAAALGWTAPSFAAQPEQAVLDRTAATTVAVPRETRGAQARLRSELGDAALLQTDPATGTPRIVAQLDGFLTPPSSQAAEEIALGYVRQHAAAFGLDADDVTALSPVSHVRAPDGTVHLAWEQRAAGLSQVDGGLQAAVTADGRLLNVRGGAIPDPGTGETAPRVSAARAYALAVPGDAPPPPAAAPQGPERATSFAGGGRAELVGYRDGGEDRLGWRLLVPVGSTAFYDALVDARTGMLERRVNRVRFAAQIRHFNLNPRVEGGSTTVSVIPDAWLDSRPGLSGPRVHAVSDVFDRIGLAQAAPPFPLTAEPSAADEVLPSAGTGADRRWDRFPRLDFCLALCSWSGANRTANREFSTAQLFWYVNRFLDHLADDPIGFSAAGGAFDGDDRIIAQSLDGALTGGPSGPDAGHVNNASMLTLPDGYRALLTTNLFAVGGARYDAAHDAGVVYHEVTHAMTDRLVTDPTGFGALTGAQPGAVSEGTSDFYALDFLADSVLPDSATPGDVRIGEFLQPDPGTRGSSGTVRTEGIDCPAGIAHPNCPGTATAGAGGYDLSDFGRVAGAPEVHADGEIWAQALWSVRTALVAAHGAAAGEERARAYVTGGLRLSPDDPSMLDMRNAIVQAAVNAHGLEDWTTVWQAFASRGMGWSASTEGPDDVTPLAAADLPPAPGDPGGRGGVAGRIADETGAPVPAASVSVAGHDTGLGATDLRGQSGADGRYLLPGVPAGRYPDVFVRKPGFQEPTVPVDVAPGVASAVDFLPLRRDFASPASGGSIASFTGADYGAQGCGPAQAIDDDKRAVWSTRANAGPQDLLIDLGRAIDLREVRIDPRAGCGDGPGASLGAYELYTSDGPGRPFERIGGGAVGEPDARGYVTLPIAGATAGRRLLLLRALSPRSLDQGSAIPFMDVAEMEVTAVPPATPPARRRARRALASLRQRTLKVSRRGVVRIRIAFAKRARRGTARLVVRAGSPKRRRVASAAVRVRPGRTVTKRVRLNGAGRRMVRRGRARRARIVVRLPGGATVRRTVRLRPARRG